MSYLKKMIKNKKLNKADHWHIVESQRYATFWIKALPSALKGLIHYPTHSFMIDLLIVRCCWRHASHWRGIPRGCCGR